MNAIGSFLDILERTDPNQDCLLNMNFDHPGVIEFPVAHIAADFVPLADAHIQAGSRVSVVGFDGASLSMENDRWNGDIIRWVSQGAQVQYLLLRPGKPALELLGRAQHMLAGCPGSLELVTIDPGPKPGTSDARLLDRWKTFHFVAFDDPKQLWVERFHEAGNKAQCCAYFPPGAAERSPLWSMLSLQFRHIVTAYGHASLSAGKASRKLVEA